MNVLFLRDRIGWFGSHTGYEQLTGYLPIAHSIQVVEPRKGPIVQYVGSAYARLNGNPGRRGVSFSQLEFRWQRKRHRPFVSHVLYLEHHLELLGAWAKVPQNVIGTIHLPSSTWTRERCAQLSQLSSVITLYQRDIPFFEKQIGNGRVRFIHHGADTDFFKPDDAQRQRQPRILYSGVYLRNEPMLARVVERLSQKIPDLRFDLLVPEHHRAKSALGPLMNHPAVTWHAGLSDEDLRTLYQRASLLLLPMNDSGANTAVVEALASGLPLATTDVGGIRDYGGETIFPVVSNNDDDAMIALVEQYLSQPVWRDEISRKCRQFAESTLAWPLVAQQHLKAYEELAA